MTQAIEDKTVVIIRASGDLGEPTARPQAQAGTELLRGAATQIGGRWPYLADEPSHIHIPRPSRVQRSEVDDR